jgi:hypothetical protein
MIVFRVHRRLALIETRSPKDDCRLRVSIVPCVVRHAGRTYEHKELTNGIMAANSKVWLVLHNILGSCNQTHIIPLPLQRFPRFPSSWKLCQPSPCPHNGDHIQNLYDVPRCRNASCSADCETDQGEKRSPLEPR